MGSVNAPGHHHKVETIETLTAKLTENGFLHAGGARGPSMHVFGEGQKPVPGMYCYGVTPA